MSVYISGMEMPKDCKNCPMLCDYSCRALQLEPDWGKSGRDDRCPLVPVSPHGDLIDRNKLYEKTAEWEAQALHMVEVTMHDEDTTEWRKWSTILTERSAFKFDVADAPTIIPASEEGE